MLQLTFSSSKASKFKTASNGVAKAHYKDCLWHMYVVNYFEATSTTVNMLKQTVVKSYVCIYNKIEC